MISRAVQVAECFAGAARKTAGNITNVLRVLLRLAMQGKWLSVILVLR
jgi:hypothetical protein